jgi:hypothetical protein
MAISRVVLVLTIFLLIPVVSASCDDGQIDINIASAEKLEEIVNIGEKRAEQMITLRPFSSVDDMTRIVGIAEITLAEIKDQDLACVNGQEGDEDEEEPEEAVNTKEPVVSDITSGAVVEDVADNSAPEEPEIIILNPQVIKSDEITKDVDKNYAIYLFVGFCFLIIILFIMKNRKEKNEFG